MRTRSCLLSRRVPVDRPSDTERGVDVASTVLDRWSHLTWATLARLTQTSQLYHARRSIESQRQNVYLGRLIPMMLQGASRINDCRYRSTGASESFLRFYVSTHVLTCVQHPLCGLSSHHDQTMIRHYPSGLRVGPRLYVPFLSRISRV